MSVAGYRAASFEYDRANSVTQTDLYKAGYEDGRQDELDATGAAIDEAWQQGYEQGTQDAQEACKSI